VSFLRSTQRLWSLQSFVEKNDKETKSRERVIILLQDMLEAVTRNMIEDGSKILDPSHGSYSKNVADTKKQLCTLVRYPCPTNDAWMEQIKRLHLPLNVKESATDVPVNLEARCRIAFFTNSLFMDMPSAPKFVICCHVVF